MKKLLFILLFVLTSVLTYAQLPDNWAADTDIESFQEASIVHEGNYSCGIIVNSGLQVNCDFDNEIAIDVVAGETSILVPFSFI